MVLRSSANSYNADVIFEETAAQFLIQLPAEAEVQMSKLPFQIGHVGVPPIKCQGIKTKLVPFIFSSLQWEGMGGARWVEPFLGSGVVALNLAPEHALLADTNKHIIGLYQATQRGELDRG